MTGSRLLATTLASLLILVGSASSASGHASEVSTMPEAGSSVSEVPAEVVIEFDSPIMEAGLAVVVRDPRGTIVSDSAPAVDRNEVRVGMLAARGLQGVFGVAYRVVSDDGHAIAGTFEFTVIGDGTAPAESAPVETDPAGTDPAVSAASESPPAQVDVVAGDSARVFPLIVVGLAVLLIVGAGLALRWRRGHRIR